MPVPLPATPYVPGKMPRPDEDAWEEVRQSALARTETESAARNPAWIAGLDLFEAGYWWEAHEVLEPVWMNAPANAPERAVVQAVIQIANGALKLRMDRPRAAQRLATIARDLIDGVGGETRLMDLSRVRIVAAIAALEDAAETGTIPDLHLR